MGPLIFLLQAREQAWPVSALGQGYGEFGSISRSSSANKQSKGPSPPSRWRSLLLQASRPPYFMHHFLLVVYFSLKVFGLIVEQVKTKKINDKCQRFFFPVCMIRGMRTTSFSEYIYLGTLFGFNFCILTTCAHLHNWMAWCKTDLSDIFGQIFFPSKVLCFSI